MLPLALGNHMHRALGLILLAGILAALVLLVNEANASLYPPQWKWTLLPTCTGSGESIAARAYITPFPYPGASNDNIIVEILNPGSVQNNISLHMHLPSGWLPSTINRSITLTHGINRVIISDVYIPEGSTPDTYYLTLVFERPCSSGSSVQITYLPITLSKKPRLELRVINATWLDGYAYPGMRGEELILWLKNTGPYTITSYTARIILPEGLYVSGTNRTQYLVSKESPIEPGSMLVLSIPVDIDVHATPGQKEVSIEINATITYNGALLHTQYSKDVSIPLNAIPELKYTIEESGWLTGAAYPGEKGATLHLSLMNLDSLTITDIYANITLPKGMSSLNKTQRVLVLSNLAKGYGSSIDLQLEVNIDPRIKPGKYYALVNITAYGIEPSGAHGLRHLTVKIPLKVLRKASLDLDPIHINWSDERAYPGEINSQLIIILRSKSFQTITYPTVNISIEGLNVSKLIVLNNAITYGDVVRIQTAIDIPKEIKPGKYIARIIVTGIVNQNGQEYLGVRIINKTLSITAPRIDYLEVIASRWSNIVVGNKAFAATPQILVRNTGSDRIEQMTIRIASLSNAKLRGNLRSETITYSSPLAPGQATWISLPSVNITNTSRLTEITLVISVTAVTPSGGVYTAYTEARIVLPSSIEHNVLRVAAVNYITPHLLPGAMGAEISLRIANTAPEPVYILGIMSQSKEINVSIAQSTCLSAPIPPGQACTLTIRLYIPSYTSPGIHTLKLFTWYSYNHGTDVVTGYQELNASIVIENTANYEPKLVVDAYWAPAPGLEPVAVLPGDTAPLQIIVYNNGPSDARGVTVSIDADNVGKPLSAAPSCSVVPSGSSCTMTIYLRINRNASPGDHVVRLHLSYVFSAYNVYELIKKDYEITLHIDNDDNAVRLAYAYWLSQPSPGTRSAQLAVYVLSDPRLVSSIKALSLKLPQCLFNPDNGSHYVLALPAGASIQVNKPQQLISEELLKSIVPGSSSALIHSMFIAKIGIGKDCRGTLPANVTIYWIDRLNQLRVSRYSMVLPTVGGTSYISVSLPSTIILHGGVANLTLVLRNNGSTALYNVYIALIPTSYTAYPEVSTKYVPVMLPQKDYKITYQLHYNPGAFGSHSSYTFSGVLAVLYETPTGLKEFYNTSLSVILRPPISLQLMGLKARWSNGTLIVEGIVSNTGTEQAKTVSVELVAGNRSVTSLIGDIDAGSEAPFRMEARTKYVKQVVVQVIYHDSYGAAYYISKKLSVQRELVSNITSTPPVSGINKTIKDIAILLVIASVLSLLYLYRRLRHKEFVE